MSALILGALSIATTPSVGRTAEAPIESIQATHPIAATTIVPIHDEATPSEAPAELMAESFPGLVGANPEFAEEVPTALGCQIPSEVTPAALTPAPSKPVPPAPIHSTRAVAAFLGDSYSSGWNGLGVGNAGWPAIVSAALKLEPLNQAVAGTGFVNPGWTSSPVRTRLSSVIQANPRVVFLASGHNDEYYDSTTTANAARSAIDKLRAGVPRAVLVIVGPIWNDGEPPDTIVALNDELRRKAAAIRAAFIDPIRDGWFSGAAQQLISGDGIHPTNAGHRRIADKVLRAMAAPAIRARLAPPPVVAKAAPATPTPPPTPSTAAPCPA